jgi:plasmid stabilization system protein ParE
LYTLNLLEEAGKEFIEAAQWYEQKSKGLGDRFIAIMQRKLHLIQQFPERYPKRRKNFREAVIRTFPYIIIYTFYKKEGIIIVNAIFHASRNPRKKYHKPR